MKNQYTIIFLLVFAKIAFAEGEWTPSGGRTAAAGLTSATMCDVWSAANNQAGLAFFDKSAAGIYFENRFLAKELGYQSAAVALKTAYGMLGATLGYSGDANFNTMKAGLAYGKKFGSRFAAGIQLDYIGTALGEEYGKRSNITFEAGVMVKLTDQLMFGMHAFNPIHAKISDFNNERIPVIINGGLGYTFSNKLLLTAEAVKNSEHDMEFRSGAEFRFSKMASVRAGVTTNPFRYTFGFGLEMKSLSLDLSSSVHQQLGYSPQVSLQYTFGK